MNEFIPPPPAAQPTPPVYKDRSAGLIVFGIFTVLLGGLAALFIPFMLLGQVSAAKATHVPTNFTTILPAASIYGVLAVALIWLGIGSMQARRWARALLLVFSWSWLLMGIIVLVVMASVMPKVLAHMPATTTPDHPAMPPGFKIGMMIGMFLFLGFFFILLPAVWTFFYGSRHVKATCEARDLTIRWTDACPLPVLGLSLWLVFSVPMMVLTSVSGHSVMPFFGMFLTGLPGALFCLAIAALWSYAAWMIYHLKSQGWWLILIGLIVFMASTLVTFARHDVREMYQLMGYPQAQIEQIQKSGMLLGNRMTWLMTFSVLPFLGYLLFVKKYFRSPS